ncbi:glycosyl transferase [Dulcicalothrix desertica PCC 7102]|uniref:Glycosyl transferase n=1 Tax=Dulcicalothrix desertica PCC 7102 TaxID=232991 RepID=A0A433UME4_9CYAN|nr:hormogonium polysaccharide biosynthesis glycosyltransferase HpsP [Dulcicalothrix desertica]RUS94995.1 glycosyl transferase [Dulcicalothrix desertica PCC 7102]TWH51427.1 glycosyltransferase involved in cell wall biosynthesis [Dulcicalothrix desertica PCC 7102]
MKILQIVPSISLIYGGPSQMVLGLAPALVKHGAEVTILTTDSNGDTGQKPLDVPLQQPIKRDGYEIIYFRCVPFRRYKFSLSLLKWLNEHAHEYDVAHLHALFSPVTSAAAAICRQNKLPYILRPLGTLDPADLRKKKYLKKIYAAFLERSNIAGASALHFTSNQEAKVSERFGVKTRDIILPLGVTPSANQSEENIRAKYCISENVPIILFMSRIDPKKGLDLLIPALERIQAQGLNFHFILAGTNPQDPNYETSIRTQLENSPLHQHTTITGFVTGASKSALLEASDIFVLPSYYENFGIAVAEAMVAGRPVVISDQVHIWHEIYNSQSGWVSKTEINSLTEAIIQALQNPQERIKRGANAKECALNSFSWDAIGHQMVEYYREIMT